MANEKHVSILREGVSVWNAWLSGVLKRPISLGRQTYRDYLTRSFREPLIFVADLSGGDLRDCILPKVNLEQVNLAGANLGGVLLTSANIIRSDLTGTILEHANLDDAEVADSDLLRANLQRAFLHNTRFLRTKVNDADFTRAVLAETTFSEVNLSDARGLVGCTHRGPSIVDFRTLVSGELPRSFLRGIGLPELVIEFLPSLLRQPIQHYSCFISFSLRDQPFTDRIHADLQDKGVRCWFAPHDMPIGGKILDEIDAAIRLRDRVLLILSAHSIKSDWVEDEVTKAFEEERKRGQTVLFP